MNKVEKHAQICMSLNELYARKNADYGDSFGKSFTEYGLTMACIRLEDKLNRIKSLTKQVAQVSDESIVDTLMDLANYSIMTLVELAQGDTLPIEVAPVQQEPMRGEHNQHCMKKRPSCQCHTCARDGNYCCMKDKVLPLTCPMTRCPDYVPEVSER